MNKQSLKIMGLAILAACALFIGIVGTATAADKMLDTTITSVTVAKDKNGAEYVRAIVADPRSLNGINYDSGAPIMFFGPTASIGKTLKAGDKIKVIVSERQFNGNTSYTALKLVSGTGK
jgi:hypothetical protein